MLHLGFVWIKETRNHSRNVNKGMHPLTALTEKVQYILQCFVRAADPWWLLVGETDQTVCRPVPVSGSQNDPILWPRAATWCRRRPTVHAEVADRCGRRESRAVDTQMGSTDNFRVVGSKLLPPPNLHAHLWPLGADVAMEQRWRASSLFSSPGWCRWAMGCCSSTHLPDDLKMSRNYCW